MLNVCMRNIYFLVPPTTRNFVLLQDFHFQELNRAKYCFYHKNYYLLQNIFLLESKYFYS